MKGARVDWIRRNGQERRADEQGRIWVAKSPGMLVAAYRSDQHIGLLEIEPTTEGPLELAVHPVARVSVEVVDHTGRAASDVPIQLWHGYYRRGQRANTYVFGRAITGQDGRATLEFARAWAKGAKRDGEYHVQLDLPLEDCDVRKLDWNALPADPLRFELRQTSSLRIAVQDEFGRAWPEPVFVYGDSYLDRNGERNGYSFAATAKNGDVLIPRLGRASTSKSKRDRYRVACRRRTWRRRFHWWPVRSFESR